MKYVNNKIVYEVGDWVIRPQNYSSDVESKRFNGKAFPIAGIDSYDAFFYPDNCGEDGFESIRPATQEEIDKVEEEIKVGEYKVEFFLGYSDSIVASIKVGCQTVSKDLFLKIGKKANWI